MRLSIGKTFAVFVFSSWLALCSPAVFAQNKIPEERQRTDSGDFYSDAGQIEPETKLPSLSDKKSTDEATAAPNAFGGSDKSGKNIFINNDAETIEDKSSVGGEIEIHDFAHHFRRTGGREKRFEFNDSVNTGRKRFSPDPSSEINAPLAETKNPASPGEAATVQNGKTEGFHWRSAIGQSLMFLAVQHGYAFTQPKTREAIKGKFWKDYIHSVKSLSRWDDGGRFFTNYIAHPMQGAFTGFIYVQNDPKGLKQQFGASGDYWHSRLKAMAWSAAWSTQFEIGPVSQASIGNVGLKGKQTWGDIVVTPTVGTAMLVSEDAIDRFVMKRIERATKNFYVRIFARMLLNPTRTVANVFRFKEPWYRDRPLEH